jgi:hypothetical protein
MRYHITRAYPDAVDEDYRIDAFDITELGKVSMDSAIGLYNAGHSLWSGSALAPAEVVKRQRTDYPYRYYLTTVPDGLKSNNLSTLARRPGSELLNALLGR